MCDEPDRLDPCIACKGNLEHGAQVLERKALLASYRNHRESPFSYGGGLIDLLGGELQMQYIALQALPDTVGIRIQSDIRLARDPSGKRTLLSACAIRKGILVDIGKSVCINCQRVFRSPVWIVYAVNRLPEVSPGLRPAFQQTYKDMVSDRRILDLSLPATCGKQYYHREDKEWGKYCLFHGTLLLLFDFATGGDPFVAVSVSFASACPAFKGDLEQVADRGCRAIVDEIITEIAILSPRE